MDLLRLLFVQFFSYTVSILAACKKVKEEKRIIANINFELPETVTDYTHRIGRTGRAGQSGLAITLLSVKDYKMMKEIEKELILDLGRETLDDFEPTEKKPRIFIHKRRPLSQKKGLKDKYGKPKTTKKTKQIAKQKTSKKTTKRDENRNFRK